MQRMVIVVDAEEHDRRRLEQLVMVVLYEIERVIIGSDYGIVLPMLCNLLRNL